MRPMTSRPKSWSGQSNHFNDSKSESAHSGRTAASLQVPLGNQSITSRRSPGARVYDRMPAEINVIGDDDTILEDPEDDWAFVSDSSEQQLREYEFLAEYDLFRNGGGDSGDRTPSRPSTPVQETQTELHQMPQKYQRYPQYQYIPLPSSGELIRLIQLHPGRGDDELRRRIFEKEFLSLRPCQGRYETISYVWKIGKEKKKKKEQPSYPLVCDDCPADVNGSRGAWIVWMHKSADTVLRRFRLPDDGVFLWINAICLNQKD
jgi:hypothetical protein